MSADNKPNIQLNGVADQSKPPPPPPPAPPAAQPPAPTTQPDPEAATVNQPPLPMDWQSRLSRFFVTRIRQFFNAIRNLPTSSKRFFWFLVYYVYDTSSTAYYIWLGISSMAALYDLTLIIVRSVFTELQAQYLGLWYGLDYAADFIYLMDMFVKSRTGYLEQGLLVRDLKLLAKNYVHSIGFVIDVLSLLPTDLIYLGLTTSYVIVRINRILRVSRISEFITKTEARVPSPNAFRIAIIVSYILMIIHWNGCIYYAVSKYIGLGCDQWVYPFLPINDLHEIHNDTNNVTHNVNRYCLSDIPPPVVSNTERTHEGALEGAQEGGDHEGANEITYENSIIDRYVYCYWWATVVLTNIAEINHPVSEFETFFQVANFLIGLLIFASLVGKVGTMITSMNAAQNEFQFRLDSVKQYMKFRKVTPDLQSKVLKWFDYIWMHRQMSNEDKVLRLLPEKLRAEIAIHVHLETLKRVKLFQDSELGLLVELVLKLRLQVFSPGDYICRKGDIGKEMYICKSGKLEVVADDGVKVFATLSDGSVFGEISLISIPGNKTGNRRTANVRSKGYSDLFVLSKEDLHAALREYPDAMQKLIEKGTEMLRKEGKIDEELAARHVAAEMKIDHKFGLLESHLDKLQSRVALLLNDFNVSDRTLKQRLTRMEYALTNVPAVPAGGEVSLARRQSVDVAGQQQPIKLPRTASIGGVGDIQQSSRQQLQQIQQLQQQQQQQQQQPPESDQPQPVVDDATGESVITVPVPQLPPAHHPPVVVAKVQHHQSTISTGGTTSTKSSATAGTVKSLPAVPKSSPDDKQK